LSYGFAYKLSGVLFAASVMPLTAGISQARPDSIVDWAIPVSSAPD
jgi:hypothetical protein